MRHLIRVVAALIVMTGVGCKTGGSATSLSSQAPRRTNQTQQSDSAASESPGSPLTVDLATAESVDSLLVSPGRYRVAVLSRVPKYRYHVTISQHTIQIPPLNAGTLKALLAPKECIPLAQAVDNLTKAGSEEAIPDLAEKVRTAAKNAGKDCNPDAAINFAESTKSTSAQVYNVVKGTYLRVEVIRQDSAGASQKKWVMTYTTGAVGEWSPTFGLAFPVISGIAKNGLWADQQIYFARDIGGGKFVITPEHKSHRFAMTPVVLFNFLPTDVGRFSLGGTGGLGLDPADPTALGGISLAYYSNLQLSLGLSARQESRLLGKYAEGDTVTTVLSKEQLHEQDWRLRPFFSLTFRFNENPFKKGTATTGTPAAADTPPKK